MSDDPQTPVTLTSAPSETQASLIVAALEDAGIKAMMVGELTSGLRAEAPGQVQILVHLENLATARRILRELQR